MAASQRDNSMGCELTSPYFCNRFACFKYCACTDKRLLCLLKIASQWNSWTVQIASPPVIFSLLRKLQPILWQPGGQLKYENLGRWGVALCPCVEGSHWRQRTEGSERCDQSIPGTAEEVHSKLGPITSTAFFFYSLSFRFGPVGGAAVFPS